MKLRIQGNSLRLRLLRSEVHRLMNGGRVEDTVRFAANDQAKLTYAIECAVGADRLTVRFHPGEVTVVLPPSLMQEWARGEQVGIYDSIAVGADTPLKVAIEKDFVCLDRPDVFNEDTFPNPQAAVHCDYRQ